jgi:hypothetical protein
LDKRLVIRQVTNTFKKYEQGFQMKLTGQNY